MTRNPRHDLTQNNWDNRSLGELFSELASQTGTLVRQEVQLAKTEMADKAKSLGRDAAFMGAGGVLAHVGLLALTAALVIGLGNVMPLWLSALVVGLVAVGGGYALFQTGLSAIKRVDLTPHETIETLKEDQAWARNQMK
jgi:uncharacterized membrane protein YqjE